MQNITIKNLQKTREKFKFNLFVTTYMLEPSQPTLYCMHIPTDP